MSWNDAYWQNKENRKKQAEEHHKEMMCTETASIDISVHNTEVFDQKVDAINCFSGNPESVVVNMDTVSAIFQYGTGDNKTIALNFASYKNPGGAFLNGSSAQEESLCMESTLYEVLSHPELARFYEYNNAHKNKSLYQNRGLLSPDIAFIRDEQRTISQVLTVAAPNRKAYMDHINGAKESENLKVLQSRINFIADIINEQNAEVAIMGAYGCGVFAQDPETVARLFKEAMEGATVKRIVYAVIDKGGHSKEGAYSIFKRIIER